MCFGGDDAPQAPNNAPTYSTDQAKAAGAAAEVAKDPTADDNVTGKTIASQTDTTAKSQASGASLNNLRM